MGFIMDGLDAEEYDRQYSDRDLVKRIAGYFSPQARRMLVVSIAIFMASIVSTGLPIYVSDTIDRIVEGVSETDIATIVIIVIVLGCLSWVFNFIHRWVAAQAIGNVVLQMREDAFDAVVRRDLSFYDKYPSGKIVSRVTSDTQAFSQVVTLTMSLISQILLVLLLMGYLFLVNLGLALMTLVFAPIVVFVALSFRKIARYTVTQSRRVLAEVSSHIQETVSGISVAKAFRQEHTVYDEFLDVNRKSFRINIRTGFVFNSIFPILETVAGIGTASLVYFGGLQVSDSGVSVGEWYLFLQGIQMFWFPLTSIASFWSQFQLGMAAGERVFALIDDDPAVVQTGEDKELETIAGEIVFKNVDFHYKAGELVLQNFSLTIKAGETLALVGHTGSGKSSLTKLVARFYEFQGGRILVDGHDVRSLALHNYRTHLGFVTQTPFLFDGTVMDNIRYGRPDANDAQVVAAAQQVAQGDWVTSLPNGLDTQVGERGGSLSMGQRQRVSLARVVLQNPSIFILDEATASVDPLTETLIQEGLDTVLQNRTSIVIAHRLSTIKNADRIIVLKQGEIIEEGAHEALLTQGGHYAELYNTYFRHQSLEYIERSEELVQIPDGTI